jgi:hypothetical protein
MKLSTVTVWLLFLLAVCLPMAHAQVATGSLGGLVLDPSGTAVPGTDMTARNESTGGEFKTQTSEQGLYVFPTLPPGVYSLTAEKTGFKRVSRTNLQIRVATRQELDIQLEIGDVQQTIEVTAEAPLLETTSSARGQSFAPKFMENLPLFAGGIRNPQAFVGYMPGVNARGVPEVSIAGSGGRAAEVQIDGASLIIPESGGVVFNFPAAEMFGEFKLLTGTYDAEYGRFGGGIQMFVTKSGSNQLHGSGFLNMRRDIWNANSWANNRLGRPRAKERFNEMGGSVGGPIFVPKIYDGRNKSFFFFTYSKDKRPATASQVLSTVPTARMRNGDFGEVSQVIYDPATTVGNTRQPFPNNVIPRDRWSSIAERIVGVVPEPTRPTLVGNYDFVNVQTLDRYIWSLKFDHNITESSRVSFLMTKENYTQNDLQFFPGLLGQGLEQYQRPDNWRVNHDWAMRPNLLLHSTFGYSRTRQIWDNPYQKGGATALGFGGLTGASDATPRIQFTGADGLTNWGVQDGKVGNGSQINITYQFNQGLTYIRGKHELKFGWDIRRLHTTSDPVDLAGTNGRYIFARAQTASPTNLAGTGHAFASLLLGLPDQADRVALPVLIGNIRYGYHAFYFQDNWKVTPRLTLNLGMRYDLPVGWHDLNGDYSHMDRSVPNPGAGGLPGAIVFAGKGAGRTGEKRFYDTDYTNFGPRGGFAYRLFEKTVIRGGFGIFYQTLGNGGCGCRLGFANPIVRQSDGLSGALQWDAGIQPPPGFRPPPLLDPNVGNMNNVDVFSENYGRAPRIYNWSFNVQQEVGKFLFDIAYVANRGHGLNSTVQLNQLPVDRLALGSLLQQPITSQAVRDQGFTKPYPSFPDNGTLAQALRPYPQFLDVIERNAGIGRTWYDSLQTKMERRFGDFQMMAAYTWSKSQSLGHYRQIFSQHFNVGAQDNYNYGDMKELLAFDQPHVFNLLTTYTLPFGRGKRFLGSTNALTNMLVGGWTISGIQQYRSGSPLAISAPNTLGNGVLFTFFKKANRVLGQDVRTGIDRTSLDPNDPNTRWLNPAAFTLPGQFDLGNSARYISGVRNPPVFEENLSIVKRTVFPLTGDRSIDLVYRADAFNIFNRTNFGGIVNVVGNPNFGRPQGPQVGARIITMGVRLEF